MNLKMNNKGKRNLKSTIYKSINKLYTNQQNKNKPQKIRTQEREKFEWMLLRIIIAPNSSVLQ